MAKIASNDTGQKVSWLRVQVELIEDKELPMARSKAEVCRENGWSIMESFFTGEANRLEHQLWGMKLLIDSELARAAAR